MEEFSLCTPYGPKNVNLYVIQKYDLRNMDVKCLCGEKVNIRNNIGKCSNCRNEYMGPHLII